MMIGKCALICDRVGTSVVWRPADAAGCCCLAASFSAMISAQLFRFGGPHPSPGGSPCSGATLCTGLLALAHSCRCPAPFSGGCCCCVGMNSPATTGPSFKTCADLTNDRVVPPRTSAARRDCARVGWLSASGRARLPLLAPMVAMVLPLAQPSATRSRTTRSIAAMLSSPPPVVASLAGPLSSPVPVSAAAATCCGRNFRQLPTRPLPALLATSTSQLCTSMRIFVASEEVCDIPGLPVLGDRVPDRLGL